MIQSMTGFGKSVTQIPNKKITVELKSLNSKNFDLNARIPSQYREKELDLRNIISNSLGRGKVDLSIYVEYTGEQTSTNVNTEVVKNYMDQLRDIVNASEVELLKMAVKMPDSLKTERDEIDDEEFKAIEGAVRDALTEINNFRSDEGEALEKDLSLRISNISNLLAEVIKIDPDRVDAVRERLRKGIEEIKEQADENRFEQEIVYYIEKFDITEEKVRLDN
ncbi:MAG TPA: YicC/YloC family endoribonuclease, partial [Christiangramia sp.]|nr:YicC/YloC family endoribonuclease [Christiangramia sp.]